MISGLFNSAGYMAAKKLVDAAAARHEAIAGNLANVETPGYKRVDLAPTFTAELQRAIGTKDPSQIAAVQPKFQIDSNAVAQSPDGNTVKLESELVNLQQNMLTHTLGTQLVTSRLLRLRMAITGKPT
jgi:flagellar basal-body rod protein FlgB